ncbi:MAG: cytochrome d ubiquinol oxidase subunit II, partial [Casimicrobiaceae bacterium]
MIFDYETLKVIWWCFVGAIIIVFALTDGWDLGIGILSPLLGHTNDERRVILRSIEPNWEGNQTWLIIAGGVVFAAWPLV